MTTGSDASAATLPVDGVRLAYDDVGDGPPVVLLHGFASDRRLNWRRTGWYDALAEADRRVIAPDLRGHGESEKPHDVEAYGHERFAADVVALLDHLGVERADVVGYSMGGRLAVQLLLDAPERVGSAVLGGVGRALLDGPANGAVIADALAADSPAAVESSLGRRFRAFADRPGTDLKALEAVMRAQTGVDLDRVRSVTNPVFVVAGGADELAGDPADVARLFPNATSAVVPGPDHMTAVGTPAFRERAVSYLTESAD